MTTTAAKENAKPLRRNRALAVAKKNSNGVGQSAAKEGLKDQPPVEDICPGAETIAGFEGCANVFEAAGLAEGRGARSCKRKLEGVVGEQGEKRTRRKRV